MNDKDIKSFALQLVSEDTEEGVVNVLKNNKLWDNENLWLEVDESKGNWSTIGNQQSSADTALVEKIINSVDAVLIKECLKRKIPPDSTSAPKSISEAQQEYFGIYNGKLSSIDSSVRSNLAENIFLVASGPKGHNPSYSIIDLGEGQNPDSFIQTFLSLNKGNKSRIQFVQGKYGMGGTGVFRFGSPKHNLQLIISRRDPSIHETNISDQWGVTVIRRVPPTGQMRSSIFKYLAPKGRILSFTSEALPLLPSDNSDKKRPLHHGTLMKIYEYHIGTGRLRSDATRHLHNRLSLLMPDIALPIKVVDDRHEKSPMKILSGLSVRLDEDKRENLEENFPGSGEISINGQKMDYSIYAFKIGKRDTYAGSEGVIFTVNGQVHGYLPKNFFERKAVGMSYLSDSILMIVDCSRIDRATQEKLFMNSRDRLAGGPDQANIEQKLQDIIKNHQGLRELREKRKRELIENKLQDSKPLADVLENIVKKSPSLLSLFSGGVRIKNPFKQEGASEKEEFKGIKFPTQFKLMKEYPKDRPKSCPVNIDKSRIQFETDAENDYFKRDKEPGELTLKINGFPVENYSCNLWNGIATINIGIHENAQQGDILQIQTEVRDIKTSDPFLSEFYIRVDGAQDNLIRPHKEGKRKQSSGEKTGKDRKKSTYLDIPNTIEIRRSDWLNYDFNERSALKVMDGGEDSGYDFYINMDNVYLMMEIKEDTKNDPKLLEARFKYGMVLIGIALLDFEERKKTESSSDNYSVYERISQLTSAISPTLLPMIVALGDLETP